MNIFIRNFFLIPINTFTIKAELQKEFLYSLKKANSDIERSYNQYKCQKFINKKRTFLFYNIVSFLLICPIIIIYIFRPKSKRRCEINCNAVFANSQRKILPSCLKDEYNIIQTVDFNQKANLELKDLRFIFEIIIKKPFSFYFLAKNIIKIAIYRSIIQQYRPYSFLVTSEYSFTSSILTSFCERNNVEHINIMHGEKLFFIRDSFFRFTRCYVFDKHYITLFQKLRANNNNFIVTQPPSLKINIFKYKKERQVYDFTYYLAAYNENQIIDIINILKALVSINYKVKIRPHPRYSDLSLLNKYIDSIELEDTKTISIEESLASTKNAIGLYTTVLYQAFLNNINIVFDDIVFKEEFKTLWSLDYILISKRYILLSEIIEFESYKNKKVDKK